MSKAIEIGSKIEAGKGEDHDTGVVLDVDSDTGMALVGWDSAPDKTWTPLADLTEV